MIVPVVLAVLFRTTFLMSVELYLMWFNPFFMQSLSSFSLTLIFVPFEHIFLWLSPVPSLA